MGKNRNGMLTILSVIAIFIVMWIYSGWNTYNTDLQNYETYYNLYGSSEVDIKTLDFGFYGLMSIICKSGLSFYNARIILYGLLLGILCFLTYKRSRKPIVVLLIFFAYHFVRDVVEMRNFFAFILLFLIIPYIGRNDKKSKIKLLIGLIAAASFHISYVSFFFLFFVSSKKTKNPFILFPLFFVLSFFITQYIGGWASQLGLERLDDKLSDYLSKTHIANIASFIVISLSTLTMYYFYRRSFPKFDKLKYTNNHLNEHKDESLMMYDMNVLSSVLILLSAVNFSFTGRLYGNIVFVNLIFILNFLTNNKNTKALDYIILIAYVIFTCKIFSMSEMHYLDVFTNNSLL